MATEVDLLAATLNIPVPESFIPVEIVPAPVSPGTIFTLFPPDSEFFTEINDLYDAVNKSWSAKRAHSVEAGEAVRLAEQQIATYEHNIAIWQQQVYNLQREVQWRVICANALIAAV